MNTLSFIYEFVHFVASFIPHIGICRTTHGGVRFRRGNVVKEIIPGLYFWIPAFTAVKLVPVVARPVDLPSQSVTTADLKPVTISVTLTAEISDVVTAMTKTDSIDNIIMDIAACAAPPVIFNRSFEDNMVQYGEVLKEILEETRRLLRPYGVKVNKAGLTDFTEARVYRHVGDAQFVVADDEKSS